MMSSMRWLVLVLFCGLFVGCGGADAPDAERGAGGDGDADADTTQPGTDDDADDADAGDSDAAADTAGALVGTWDAVSDQNGELPPGTLVFTYMADGTGAVVEEGGPPKAYTWVHDVDAGTLHVVTGNEDLLFDVTLEGDTLSLTMGEGDGAMSVVMRRMGAGDE